MKRYDVIVIGAGSAGLVAATTAQRLGARTALVHAARVYHEMLHADRLGPPRVTSPVQFSQVMEHVGAVVESIYEHENPEVFRRMGIDVYEAAASFESPDTVRVSDEVLGFERALVCTGSSPLVPPIPGLSDMPYLTNENVWAIRDLPQSILFAGAGPISVELGQALTRFGPA